MMKPPAAILGSFRTALDVRDTGTHTHSHRVAGYALVLGRRLGLSRNELITLEHGVFLHDIGKIHTPDRILKKAGPLSETEWKVMKSHAVTGYAMLRSIPSLETAAEIVLAHHERYDGTGYPHRLEADDIPLGARICSVADCLDALTASDRPYRRPLSFLEACRQIEAESGTHFDPQVVEAFLSVSPCEWQQLQGSVSPAVIRDLEWEKDAWPFRDLVFSGHFDKPVAKVIACPSVMHEPA
jgi:putative nucleotidyltransferase with HDIG domain